MNQNHRIQNLLAAGENYDLDTNYEAAEIFPEISPTVVTDTDTSDIQCTPSNQVANADGQTEVQLAIKDFEIILNNQLEQAGINRLEALRRTPDWELIQQVILELD